VQPATRQPVDVVRAGENNGGRLAPDSLWRRVCASGRVRFWGVMLFIILGCCLATLPWTVNSASSLYYDGQSQKMARLAPESRVAGWMGRDNLGRSLLSRCLLGGLISLGIGFSAAAMSVALGMTVGLAAGYRGGWVDSVLMRIVDVLYGLPYILMIILLKIAMEKPLGRMFHNSKVSNLVVLFLAIGLVSWLTMARVIRGQVLSLRNQPFIEAAKALGLSQWRIFFRHLLPNLIGPIVVYASLTVPQAILQESFLSFLGIGVAPPMPTWGLLASEGLAGALNPIHSRWWMLAFPCILLALTLLCLNFLGDGLRDVFDPRRDQGKI
jgi:oligopeptide transport system permease protein